MELCRKAFLRRRHKKIRASEACLKLFAQPVVISVLNETCQSSNVLSCTKKKKVKAPFPKDNGQNARQRSMRMESQPARVRLQASIVRRLVWSFSFFNVPFTFDHPRTSINHSTSIQSLPDRGATPVVPRSLFCQKLFKCRPCSSLFRLSVMSIIDIGLEFSRHLARWRHEKPKHKMKNKWRAIMSLDKFTSSRRPTTADYKR